MTYFMYLRTANWIYLAYNHRLTLQASPKFISLCLIFVRFFDKLLNMSLRKSVLNCTERKFHLPLHLLDDFNFKELIGIPINRSNQRSFSRFNGKKYVLLIRLKSKQCYYLQTKNDSQYFRICSS